MSLLIRRAKIVGGENENSELKDIFVSEEKISAIGDFPNKNAEVIIDAQGAYLSPGFIDVNTDSDHYLSILDHPSQEDFIKQGVTTIIGGMCGASLAPLLYGSLESIRKWGDIGTININWRTMREFLETLDKKPLAVNFATLAGHSTIRRALIGEHIRDLTKNELRVFGTILEEAQKEGAFGLSTGLGYAHSPRTPYPELKFLNEIVKRYNGVYATHLRNNTTELAKSIDETIKIAAETGARTIISHFMPIEGSERAYQEALEKIESIPEKRQLRFDVYPPETSVLAIYTFLPLWAQNGGRETMLANLKDEWLASRIIKDIAKINPEDFVIAQATGNDFLVKKSLKEIAGFYDTASYSAALVKLMATTQLNATIFYKNINGALIKKAIRCRRSLIATNSASFRDSGKILKPERALSTFTKFLGMAEGAKLMPFKKAINKITNEPAKMFGLVGRGEIKEGNSADLTIFSMSDGNTSEMKKVDVKSVVVNGKLVLKDGTFTEKFPGKNMRHKMLN